MEKLRKRDLAVTLAGTGGNAVAPPEESQEIGIRAGIGELGSAQAGRVAREAVRNTGGGRDGVEHNLGWQTAGVVV